MPEMTEAEKSLLAGAQSAAAVPGYISGIPMVGPMVQMGAGVAGGLLREPTAEPQPPIVTGEPGAPPAAPPATAPPPAPAIPQGASLRALDEQGRKIAAAGAEGVDIAKRAVGDLEAAGGQREDAAREVARINAEKAAARAQAIDQQILQQQEYQARLGKLKQDEDKAVADAKQRHDDALQDAMYAGISGDKRRELQKIASDPNATDVQKASAKSKLDKASQIDPDRYLGTAGRKVTAAIAQALGAMGAARTGGPNQAMEMIQKAIRNDIAAQRDNFAKREREADKAEAGIDATKKGFASQKAEELQRYDISLAMTEKKLAKIMAGLEGQEAIAGGENLAGKLKEARIKTQGALLQQASSDHQRSLVSQGGLMSDKAHIQEKRADQAAAGAAGPKELPASEARLLGELKAAPPALDDLLKNFKAKTGPTDMLPGATLRSRDTREYEDQRRATAQVIGGILEGGKLSESDFPRYYDMMPDPSDSDERAATKINIIKVLLKTKADAASKSYGQTGYRVEQEQPRQPLPGARPTGGQ